MYDRRDQDVVLLTNNHVLTQSSDPTQLPATDAIFQPAGGARIGRSKRVVPIVPAPLGSVGYRWYGAQIILKSADVPRWQHRTACTGSGSIHQAHRFSATMPNQSMLPRITNEEPMSLHQRQGETMVPHPAPRVGSYISTLLGAARIMKNRVSLP